MRIRCARTDQGARPSGQHGWGRLSRVLVPVNCGPVMVLGVLVLVVQVNVRQGQRPVGEDQRDTGENGRKSEHAAQSLPQ